MTAFLCALALELVFAGGLVRWGIPWLASLDPHGPQPRALRKLRTPGTLEVDDYFDDDIGGLV